VSDNALDPTREVTYSFVEEFVEEMAPIFPDAYWHIGGDEVNPAAWRQDGIIERIRNMDGVASAADLQVYFNKRVNGILKKHSRIMVGWDEIAHRDLPKDVVIQSWRGFESLLNTVRGGGNAILSQPYYLDHMRTAAEHYTADPIGNFREGAGQYGQLAPDATARVLGGEACMWAELLTEYTVESRIWPRAAAVSERLWSNATVRDTKDMYRRLDGAERTLVLSGASHHAALQTQAMQRIASSSDIAPLLVLAHAFTPLGLGDRNNPPKYNQLTPLVTWADALLSESPRARQFSAAVSGFKGSDTVQKASSKQSLIRTLRHWHANHEQVLQLAVDPSSGTVMQGVVQLSQCVAELSRLVLEFLAPQGADGDEAMNVAEEMNKLAQECDDLSTDMDVRFVVHSSFLRLAQLMQPSSGSLPGGSFRGSCQNCEIQKSGQALSCECSNANGRRTRTTISQPYDCEDLENINGCLQCKLSEGGTRDAETC